MSRPPVAMVMLAVALLAGCSIEDRPVGRLAVEPRALELPFPEYRTLRLGFALDLAPPVGRCPPTVFVHLVDGAGAVVRTFDHRPPDLYLGESVSYELVVAQSALGDPLPEGRYDLVFGIYDPETGTPLGLEVVGDPAGRFKHRGGEVVVGPQRLGVDLGFEGGWEDPEPGIGIQVLRRRWFHGESRIVVRRLTRPLSLWLALNLPGPDDPSGAQQILDSGAEVQRVELEQSCGADPLPAVGPGHHEVELRLLPDPGEESCTILLRPGFSIDPGRREGRRSASLDGLAWRPLP